jgi:hypothetical protein
MASGKILYHQELRGWTAKRLNSRWGVIGRLSEVELSTTEAWVQNQYPLTIWSPFIGKERNNPLLIPSIEVPHGGTIEDLFPQGNAWDPLAEAKNDV